MDKYKQKAQERLANARNGGRQIITSRELAQRALAEGSQAKREREDFFTSVYGDLLTDYFLMWLKTEPQDVESREFLFNSALALGDIKTKMAEKETLGNNIAYQEENNEDPK